MASEPMVYELKASSKEGEYYCGDLPGTLQYKKVAASLINLDMNGIPANTAQDVLWTFEPPTFQHRTRLLPRTTKPTDWRLILVMKKALPCGATALKGALIHRDTGLVALMTTFNSEGAARGSSSGDRAVKSNDPAWFVGFYRMCAPPIFWRTLKDVLQQAI